MLGPSAVRLHQVIGDILNHEASLNKVMEWRTKLGMPLYFSCVNSPIETMDYFIAVLTSVEYSPNFSLILVACVCFCFQYLPKRARERIVKALDAILPEHAVPNDVPQIASFGTFFENGGARLMPCVDVVLRTIVNHENEKVRTSVKLVSPLLATDPLNLSKILYESQNKRDLDNADLFLLGYLHGTVELPVPEDCEFVKKLLNACQKNLSKKDAFYDVECALMCYSLLISWRVVEPDPHVLQIENTSLRKLAIAGFADYVKINKGKNLPEFEITNDPVILTAYLKVICVFLNTDGCDLKDLKIQHWLLDAILNEFHTEISPNEIILQSQSPFDMSIEDLEILATVPEWLPMWFYLHLMRVRTRNSTLLKACMKILCQAPKMVMNVLFDEFIMFLDSVLENLDIIEYVSQMLHSLVPFLEGKVHNLAMHLFQTMDFYSVESVDTRLQILNTILLFSRERHPFLVIMDCLMENFDTFPLSPSFLQHIFCFFEHVVEWNVSYNNELLLMSMAVITSPFLDEPPTYLANNQRHVLIFQQCRLFFSLIASDVVLDPVFRISDSFPPCPAALRLISKLIVHDPQYDTYLSDALIQSLTICPTETVLAASIIPEDKRDGLIQAITQFLKICDRTSFTIAASQLMKVDMENLIMYDESDDLRLILRFKSEFVPLALQCRENVGLLLEKCMPRFKRHLFSGVRREQMDFQMRRVFRFFDVDQHPVAREDGWTPTEIGAASAFVRLRRKKFVDELLTDSELNAVKDSRDLHSVFRVRFPLEKQADFHKELVQAIKLYRKRSCCITLLKRLWVLPDCDDILPFCEPKLWMLKFIPHDKLKAIKPATTEKEMAYLTRLGIEKPEVDDEESILFLEKARLDESFTESLNIPSLLKLYFARPILITDTPNHIPSLLTRDLRNVVRFFASNDPAGESDKLGPQNEIIHSVILSYDLRNPVIVKEICQMLKQLVCLQTTRSAKLKKSLFTHAFMNRLLNKTPLHFAAIYDSLSTINATLDFTKSENTNRLKAFWGKYKHRQLDTSKLSSLQFFCHTKDTS